MDNTLTLSLDRNRNRHYHSWLEQCRNAPMTLAEIAQMGYQLMRREKLHHHFFGNHSLFISALHLALFSLKLPYEYQNLHYLNTSITATTAIQIIALFERRIAERIPIEYITHEAEYLGNKFYINENVLVPRSLMNTRFSDFLNRIHWNTHRVLDLCTGSGCIGITLALMNPNIKVDLADISRKALDVAQINVDRYALADRVQCIETDLFENIVEKYDLIITNPPYVSEKEYQACPLEFKNEPKIALEAGKEGLDIIHKILDQAHHHLNPQGMLIAEVGYSAAQCLKRRYPKLPFEWLNYRKSTEKESLFDTLVRWTGYLDSLFLCKAEGLSKF